MRILKGAICVGCAMLAVYFAADYGYESGTTEAVRAIIRYVEKHPDQTMKEFSDYVQNNY